MGTFVSAAIGPMYTDPNTMKSKRKPVIGQVGLPAGKGKFNVNFFGIGEEKPMSTRSLTILSNVDVRRVARNNGDRDFRILTNSASLKTPTSDIPDRTVQVSNIATSNVLAAKTPPASSSVAKTPSASSSSLSSCATTQLHQAPNQDAPVVPMTQGTQESGLLSQASITDASKPVQKNVIRTSTGVGNCENNLEEQNEDTYASKVAESNINLASLVGQEVICNIRGGGTMKWKVIPLHSPLKSPTDRSPMNLGFSFEKVDYAPQDEWIFAKIFLSLFFKDFMSAHTIMNQYVNKERVEKNTTARLFDIEEFLSGIGILIGATCFSQKGIKLFQEESNCVKMNGREFLTIEQNANFITHMKYYRWRQWITFFPFIWRNANKKYSDPWWRIRSLITDFNDIRKVLIKSSNRYCMDESMIGYRPQTSPSGNLPHISHEQRKPVDLGSELKVMSCCVLRAHLRIELLEGAAPMLDKKYNKEYGSGAGTIIRLHEEWYVHI